MTSTTSADLILLELYRHRFAGVAEEMGVTLRRTGYSPNIKERLDFSCALFDGAGRMVAQAAHIPVHLGAMPRSVGAALAAFHDWQEGDVVILNDPFEGGTHLPDLTMISPIFAGLHETDTADDATERGGAIDTTIDADNAGYADPAGNADKTGNAGNAFKAEKAGSAAYADGIDSDATDGVQPAFFAVSRAHHADVGGMTPGSLPLSNEIYQEGIIIPPIRLYRAGAVNDDVMRLLLRNVRTPDERRGDLAAQRSAHAVAERRIAEMIALHGLAEVTSYAEHLMAYSAQLMRASIGGWPKGCYVFEDYLTLDENREEECALIRVTATIENDIISFDFDGTSEAVDSSLNAVIAITESACFYVASCLAGEGIPINQGSFEHVRVIAPAGCVVNAGHPHAVAAGNVETSQRIVDAVLGALAQAMPKTVPSASQGTMNNLTIGGRRSDGTVYTYYETIGGGMGASPDADGLDGVHVHMTNTLNTPVEALEMAFPFRIGEYRLRRGSGGRGLHRGGDGLVRSYRFDAAAVVTMLSERRDVGPRGIAGGTNGAPGSNVLVHKNGREEVLPSKFSRRFVAGEALRIETPGGGGWGSVIDTDDAGT